MEAGIRHIWRIAGSLFILFEIKQKSVTFKRRLWAGKAILHFFLLLHES